MKKILLISIITILLADCTSKGKFAEVSLSPTKGNIINGKVLFSEKEGEVTMEAYVSRASPGIHAIHIHANGDCSASDAQSAGGHWNPTDEDHGNLKNPKGSHKGDIGNLEVDDKGEGSLIKTTSEWCIGCGNPTKDILGKAIIIHANRDDFVTQPSGAAGSRIACGVIEKKD